MKILRFVGKKINGYLDLDVRFYEDLTFVTGINGSGKTTLLNSVVSLLMPRLDFLALQEYEEISIEIEQAEKRAQLSSRRTKNGAVLSITEDHKSELEIFAFEWDDTTPSSRNREMEQSFFRDQVSRNVDNPVMQFIQKLPTPMFLGLDRRALSYDESLHRFQPRIIAQSRKTRRNVFSQSLTQSLNEALGYAFESYRQQQQRKVRLDEQFRRDLVLDLLDFPLSNFPSLLDLPTSDEFSRIEKSMQDLKRLPELLNVPEAKINEKIAPLFRLFEDTKLALTARTTKKRSKPSEKETQAMLAWSFNQSQLQKIASISERISKYNDQVSKIFSETQKFTDTLAHFFSDSGKKVIFDTFGELVFKRDKGSHEYDIRSLSSGEVQIIVILAHLHFNPEVRKASIFIIDEPELSLHVEWQERFIDALIRSSANTQYILATHSPSIILDKVENCRDITPGRR